VKYFIGLGANLGDAPATLRKAVELIEKKMLGRVIERSSLYFTEPIGGPEQPWYYNAAVALESGLQPPEMLAALRGIETELGRERKPGEVNQPRSIDLDILLAGDIVINRPELTVPHPRLHSRRFALEPLVELAPDFIHPVLKKSLKTLLDELGKKAEVKKLEQKI
jgi:2-amino-4-hydroxy-6-hydroxymethyldihydropteridine diphosphokinase